MTDITEFYKQLAYDCELCTAAQAAEMQKAKTGDCLARQRATELNTYLTIFRIIRSALIDEGFDAYSPEEVVEMISGVDDTRDRFVRLLAYPQYAGRTGEIVAE